MINNTNNDGKESIRKLSRSIICNVQQVGTQLMYTAQQRWTTNLQWWIMWHTDTGVPLCHIGTGKLLSALADWHEWMFIFRKYLTAHSSFECCLKFYREGSKQWPWGKQFLQKGAIFLTQGSTQKIFGEKPPLLAQSRSPSMIHVFVICIFKPYQFNDADTVYSWQWPFCFSQEDYYNHLTESARIVRREKSKLHRQGLLMGNKFSSICCSFLSFRTLESLRVELNK